jgi:perosamine synthetase
MKNIPQFMPMLGDEEYRSIKDCFDSNWFTEGPKARDFKERLLSLTGAKYGEFAPNGTLAIYLALKAAGVKTGDEVLVPNFTFIASANSVIMAGATPIFVDVDCNLQIDLGLCEKKITDKTTVIMAAHMYGTCGDMTAIKKFAEEHSLILIEDAAQALGVYWDGQHAGTFGEVGTFSFFADKTITCGEGGFIVTNNEEIATQMIYLRNQGRIDRGTFIHPVIGYNFRITDIHAAVGLAQIGKLDWIRERKLEIYNTYKNFLGIQPRFTFFKPQDSSSFLPFRVCLIDREMRANEVITTLKDAGVEPRTFFYPLHRQPCFVHLAAAANYQDKDFEISNLMYDSGVCLPTFLQITNEEIEYVCNIIKSMTK